LGLKEPGEKQKRQARLIEALRRGLSADDQPLHFGMAAIRVPREAYHKHSSQAFFSSTGRLRSEGVSRRPVLTPSGRKRPKWKVSNGLALVIEGDINHQKWG
jgi:hypothetical protein